MVTAVPVASTSEVSEVVLSLEGGQCSFEWPKGEGPRLSDIRGAKILYLNGDKAIDIQFLTAIRQGRFDQPTPTDDSLSSLGFKG